MTIFSKTFLADAAERAIATFAQAVLGLATVLVPAYSLTNGLTLAQSTQSLINSLPLLLAAGLAAGCWSVLKSIVASFKGDPNSASLIK